MATNVGTVDKILRLVVGVILIAYAIPLGFPKTSWNWVGWIGVIPIITALIGNCPLYSILGINTCPMKKS